MRLCYWLEKGVKRYDRPINPYLFSIVVALGFLVIARQWLNKRKLMSIITQLTADNILLKSEIQRLSELSGSFPHEETEGFIKFLSQSRDWAFTYIEDVQKAMQELFVALMGAEEEQIKKQQQDWLSSCRKKIKRARLTNRECTTHSSLTNNINRRNTK